MLIPFSNIKKAYLQISKYLAQFFCSSPFQIIKKAYLQILKYLAVFLLIAFLKIVKKYTYESQNTPFHTKNNFKGNNSHKNHYTNNSHKNNYTNR